MAVNLSKFGPAVERLPFGLNTAEAQRFVVTMVDVFSTAEREAWGSTFAKAERAGWVKVGRG